VSPYQIRRRASTRRLIKIAFLGTAALSSSQGGIYVSVEGRSMMIGALALAIYSVVVCQLLMRLRASAIMATRSALAVWFALSLGLKQLLIG
jgi:hypothetical protein